MDLFKASTPKADLEQIERLKAWVYEAFAIPADIPVSISQLACHKPGCPPIETVIAIMTHPPQQYKLHQAVHEIAQQDVDALSKSLG
ncbi:hypothetical protein [Acaryochloris sp. CCMEE 5410]|uniref:hypothetical protein n=1 Tax=Acaryochloris sp. CCMEE 5410 TaxID=310037 RepID=UPI000248411A|nr:hypothetical protein [Acaryochloris sp. CCMEE 5410]KAI9134764.1 hypothetical protein ON05_016865 [Acaryochloris sp. CCMEE 5410]